MNLVQRESPRDRQGRSWWDLTMTCLTCIKRRERDEVYTFLSTTRFIIVPLHALRNSSQHQNRQYCGLEVIKSMIRETRQGMSGF